MADPEPSEGALPASADGPPALTVGDDAASATHGFLFADLRDYTQFLEARGDRAGAALLARYRSLVREAVATAHGAEIRTEGDGVFVVFPSASGAVRCGLAIVAATEAATAASPAEPIRVGVGVHAGETIETAEGSVGSAVNIAARLCAQAKAGEVVVSETVRGMTRTVVEVDFVPLGARRLKGVAEPVPCYRVTAKGMATGKAGARRPTRRSTLLAAGLATVAIVALVAVGATVLGGGLAAPTPTPGPSGAALASPSLAASAPATAAASPTAPAASPTLGPFPNEVEARILAALPPPLAQSCVRGGTPDDARLAGFTSGLSFSITPSSFGGLTCRPDSGADRLYVMAPRPPYSLEWEAPANSWLGLLEGRYHIPDGSCATQTRAYEPWTGRYGSGYIACMNPSPYDGRPWIYFTFGDGRYLAFATRNNAAEYDALYRWFDQLKTFLP